MTNVILQHQPAEDRHSNRGGAPAPVETVAFCPPSAAGTGVQGNLQEIQHMLNICLPNLSRKQLIFLQNNCKIISKIKENMKFPWRILKGVLFKQIEQSFRLVWPEQSTVDLLMVLHKQNSITI